MAEQLALVLKDDLEQLIPAMIAWNNTELMEAVKKILPQYENTIYTADNIAQAKDDKARLNAFAKALNAERLQIKKQYTAPLDKFTGEVNEVIALVFKTADRIALVINDYDKNLKSKKREKILAHFQEEIKELESVIPFEKVEDSKWYNASVSLKTALAAVTDKVAQIRQDLSVIEALGTEDTDNLKLYYFRTLNLTAALQQHEALKSEKARIEALKATEAQKPTLKAAEPQNDEMPWKNGIEPTYKIRFEVEGTKEDFQLLKEFLLTNGIKYMAIKED